MKRITYSSENIVEYFRRVFALNYFCRLLIQCENFPVRDRNPNGSRSPCKVRSRERWNGISNSHIHLHMQLCYVRDSVSAERANRC